MIVAGVGALLFVVAAMVRFYVAPALAVAPMDQNSVTYLEARDALLFDSNPDVLAPITTDLTIRAKTVGDVKASEKAPGDAVVWTGTTTITSADGVIRSQSTKRAAFDKRTAEAVNCCGGFMETTQDVRQDVKRTGLMFKFPFGTEKKSYQVWDDTAAKAVTTTFKGVTKVHGMKAFVFENDVPATVVGSREVPGSILGIEGTDAVTADSYYQNHTTYYVEPVTGAIINQVQDTKSWLNYDGYELVTTKAHIQFTEAQVKDMVDNVLGSQPTLLSLTQGFVPWVVMVLGLGLIGLGLGLTRRHAA